MLDCCSACLMSMGGEHTATTSSFKSVEQVVEVTAKRRLFLVTSVTPISTLKMVKVWTAARHTSCVSAVYLGKILINCWRLASRIINKEGTTKMRKQRNEKMRKRKYIVPEVQKKLR